MMMSAPWKNTLELAYKLGKDVDEENAERLRNNSQNWFCCAIGEKLGLEMPENSDGSMDNLANAILDTSIELNNEGNRFAADVAKARYAIALGTIERIHKLMTPDIITEIQKRYITRQRITRRVRLETGDLPSDDMKVEGRSVSFD